MILCAVTGCAIGVAATVFAFLHADSEHTTGALFLGATGFIASGAVAIALRTKKGQEPGDGAPV
jgi:membrane protease YdiL (CAAX protease family)